MSEDQVSIPLRDSGLLRMIDFAAISARSFKHANRAESLLKQNVGKGANGFNSMIEPVWKGNGRRENEKHERSGKNISRLSGKTAGDPKCSPNLGSSSPNLPRSSLNLALNSPNLKASSPNLRAKTGNADRNSDKLPGYKKSAAKCARIRKRIVNVCAKGFRECAEWSPVPPEWRRNLKTIS